MLPEKKNKREIRTLRSEFVQEIVSRKPSFIEQWSILLFLFILFFIFLGTWFIKYPDIISVNASLISINAPKEIKTKLESKLIKLNVKEEEQVHTSDLIGMMESTGNHYEIIDLSKRIDSAQILLANNITEIAVKLFSKQYKNLGEIRQSYQTFTHVYQLFKQCLIMESFLQKKEILQNEAFGLSQEALDSNQKLEIKKISPSFNYATKKTKMFGKSLIQSKIGSVDINNENLQFNKQDEITELRNKIFQQKNVFQEAVKILKAQLDDWKARYLLIAPISGRIYFSPFLQENQQLQNNQSICFIYPPNSEYYAVLNIPQNNFRKIKQGQRVLLKFPLYPYEEFGSVEGRLDFISHVPTDSGYVAKVLLPKGLNTNCNKNLKFKNGLKVTGEIITKDVRLIERFLTSSRNTGSF